MNIILVYRKHFLKCMTNIFVNTRVSSLYNTQKREENEKKNKKLKE